MVGEMVMEDAERTAEVEKQISDSFAFLPFFVESSGKDERREQLLDAICGEGGKLLLARRLPEKEARMLSDIVWEIRNEVQDKIISRLKLCSWEEPIMMEHAVSLELLSPCFGLSPGGSCFTTVYEGWDYDMRAHVDNLCARLMVMTDAENGATNGGCDYSNDFVQAVAELLLVQLCIFPVCTEENRISLTTRNQIDMINLQGEASICMHMCHEYAERMDLLYDVEDEMMERGRFRARCMLEACVTVLDSEKSKVVNIVFKHNYLDDDLSQSCSCRWCSTYEERYNNKNEKLYYFIPVSIPSWTCL
jgi:hypothetical protein